MLEALRFTLSDVWSRNIAKEVTSSIRKAVSLLSAKSGIGSGAGNDGEEEGEELFGIPAVLRQKGRGSLPMVVLDLDETLVHTRGSTPPEHDNYQ